MCLRSLNSSRVRNIDPLECTLYTCSGELGGAWHPLQHGSGLHCRITRVCPGHGVRQVPRYSRGQGEGTRYLGRIRRKGRRRPCGEYNSGLDSPVLPSCITPFLSGALTHSWSSVCHAGWWRLTMNEVRASVHASVRLVASTAHIVRRILPGWLGEACDLLILHG